MKDKKLIALIGLAVLAFISLLYGIFTPSKSRRNSSSAGPAVSSAGAAAGNFVFAERKTQKGGTSTWGRNPFTLKESGGKGGKGLLLNGIAWDEIKPTAVIDDQIVEVGGEIDGNKVVRIEPARVVLNDGESDFELRLGAADENSAGK